MYPDNGNRNGRFARALAAFGFTPNGIAEMCNLAAIAVLPTSGPDTVRNFRASIAYRFATETWHYLAEPFLGIPVPLRGITDEAVVATGNNVPGFLRQLMDSLKEVFNPGGNQMFTLQFPGRFVDQGSFAWDTKSAGVYGQFIKSTAINESEFRLVDQLYDFSDNVAGPNGSNLSMVYEEVSHR
jgi:hypothetical protein